MNKEKATERIGIRVTPNLKLRIEQRAEEEGRSPSNIVIKIITDYLDKVDEAKKLIGDNNV